jgi:hypothetical protein
MVDAVTRGEKIPDLAYVHGAGLSRIPSIIKSLRPIGVQVRVVADFDVLRESKTLQAIYESLGGDRPEIEKDVTDIQNAIAAKRPELPLADVDKEINAILASETSSVLSQKAATAIKKVLKKSSAWETAKTTGAAFIPSGPLTRAFQELTKRLRTKGLYILDVGEMECFCKSVDGHGPEWVIDVLERDLENDPELHDARVFATQLVESW